MPIYAYFSLFSLISSVFVLKCVSLVFNMDLLASGLSAMSPHSSKFVKPMKTLVEEQVVQGTQVDIMSDDELDELELTEANMIRKAAKGSKTIGIVRKSNTEESLSKLVQISTPSVMSSGYGSQPLSGTPVSEEDSVSTHSSGNEETPSTIIENKISREVNGNGLNSNNVSTTSATRMVSNNLFTSSELNRSNDGDNDSVSSKGSKTGASQNVVLPDWMAVGESVRVSPDSKTGIISFIGSTHFQPGLWVGVTLDAPTGKNDGSVNGVSYFNCKPRFGIFVKPDKLKLDVRGKTLRSSTGGTSTSSLKSDVGRK